MIYRLMYLASLMACICCAPAQAQSRKAPPGRFKDLDDVIAGNALILHDKQLFIDDYVIEKLDGVEKVLNQPVKHSRNPIVTTDQPWEQGQKLTYATVMFDQTENIFKLWYGCWLIDAKPSEQVIGYATSQDGIVWKKPIVNEKQRTNIVATPKVTGFQAPGIFRDPVENDPGRRFKMLYAAAADGTSKTWSTNAAYSPDGIHWTAEPQNPLIPSATCSRVLSGMRDEAAMWRSSVGARRIHDSLRVSRVRTSSIGLQRSGYSSGPRWTNLSRPCTTGCESCSTQECISGF